LSKLENKAKREYRRHCECVVSLLSSHTTVTYCVTGRDHMHITAAVRCQQARYPKGDE